MAKRWMLALAAAMGLAGCTVGCSQVDAVKAASTIHAYLPTVMALANEVAAIAAGVDAAEATQIQSVSAKVQAELQELESASGAYAAGPTSSGWLKLSAVVDQLVSDADAGLMAALEIKNPASQAKAKIALSALDAAIHIVDGYLAEAQTAAATGNVASPLPSTGAGSAAMARASRVTPYWSASDRARVEKAFGVAAGF